MKRQTLHQTIVSEIEGRVLSGDWPPGYRIPFEHELMEHYGCARMTVNKALAGLVKAGLIVRRQRAGSFVAHPRPASAVLDIPDIEADISGRGMVYRMTLLTRKRRKPDAKSADERQLAGTGDLLALTCLHLADGRPFALEDRLISLGSVPEAATVDFGIESPGHWLLGHVPWTEAEHRIGALNADRRIADLLDIEPGTACLALSRRTWRGDDHITHVVQYFPGSAFDLVARFTPQGN
jgi:GntR family histidine utilization transcriptional repressor